MSRTVFLLAATLLLLWCSLATEHKKSVGFLVTLMPPCQSGHRHRSATDFMGNSIALEVHSSGSLTINGGDFTGRPWIAILKKIFSTRGSKTLLIWIDEDVRMGQALTVLDQLQEAPFINKMILLTSKQSKDIRDDFCIMDDPSKVAITVKWPW